jgi:hypothetical protein
VAIGDVKVSTLWFRVLKRVYPDLAIDKQDRPHERIARQANDAYSKRDEVLLRAVPAPKGPSPDPWKTGVPPEPATPRQSQFFGQPARSFVVFSMEFSLRFG